MKEYKVPIQSLIDHIKTAVDVDPWAKEMAEDLLKELERKRRICTIMFNRCYAVNYGTMCGYCGCRKECAEERTV